MKRLILILASVLPLLACTREPRLVILHTNDVHSHFEPVRSDDGGLRGGILERAAFIDSVRLAEGPERVLYLHAGDFSQGSSYFTEFGGDLEIAEQNALGCDCVALGNHEFDNGIEDLARRLSLLECPAVCANIDFTGFEVEKYVRPYAIIERGGMKVGIIGLAPDLSDMVSRVISSRMQQLDPVEVTCRYASELKEQRCDLIVLLSHTGYDEDCRITAETRGVDLVIGGHSHTFLEDFTYVRNLDGKNIPIIQDGCWGLEMGKVSIY